MKPSTRLSSAVFQLTPTRTRCDLIIIANDKKEKIASGLLNPFLAHLKTAQDQIAKGGYSILLQPETETDASWFTKATLERFVRFVSTPEVLERVYTIETEILQIEEAIAKQRSNDIKQSIVEDHQKKPLGCYEGSKSEPNAIEKAIVLYEPGAPRPEANGSCLHEGNSKIQLLKVLETRKIMLQKEQGMAFARAAAAGFDIDDMAPLVSFAECFGAMRLMEACSRCMELWKSKHEIVEWLDIEASEALSTRSGFSAMNPSSFILSTAHSKRDESSHELASEDKGKPDNPAPNGQREHFQGQFPPMMFPPWPMHAPPGRQPVFQPYTVQGMPYYQAYTGHEPFSLQPQCSMEHQPSNFGDQTGQKTQFLDNMDTEISDSGKPRKKSGRSKRNQTGMVVIRNLNYVTSKEMKSDSESNSDSDSESGAENENFENAGHGGVRQNSKTSSKSKENHLKSENKLNSSIIEVPNIGKDTDGQWQAFQNCLLRGSDEDSHAGNEGMFAVEKDVKIMTRANSVSIDPLALGARDTGEIQDHEMSNIHRISGSSSCRPRGSGDVLFSSMDNNCKETNYQTDLQFADTNGRKILPRKMQEDFMIGSQQQQSLFRNSLDPLALNSFEGVTNKLDRDVSHGITDETFMVPFRSMSIDQVGQMDRLAIDIESEIPSLLQRSGSDGNVNRVHYEPDDLSLMPERGTERKSGGYDPALDYEMEVCAEEGPQEKSGTDDSDMKGGLRKSNKDRRPKTTSDSLYKQRTGGPLMKSKMSPSADARARAESLRSYKADLQKIKKEKEEAEAKRLEALRLERQRRIAARGSSTSVKPFALSPQTKQFPTKLSPITNRGSKFSDSAPGPSSPLQRSKIRTSLGSSELLKASKASKLTEGSHMAGNRLTRSTSSLSETKIENDAVTPDSKAPTARVRRLSEPKAVNSPSMKARSAEAISKRKLYEGPERNKISAIINLDRSKAATLPVLKIKTSKSHVNEGENRSAVNDQKLNKTAELNVSNCERVHHIDADDNTIVEKTVVMLEYGKPFHSALHSSGGDLKAWNQCYDDRGKGEKSDVISELEPVHAPPSPMDEVHRYPIISHFQNQLNSSEVKRAYSDKDSPKFTNTNTVEKPDRDSYAPALSVEDPCTSQMEYVKPQVPDVQNLKMHNNPATSHKTLVKEYSKGLRRLLKFGKKNHTSSSGDKSFDSDCTSVDGNELDTNGGKVASRGEVHTLKNLISQDETPSASNAPRKTSRHFSLLSPFRFKTSEKKQAS